MPASRWRQFKDFTIQSVPCADFFVWCLVLFFLLTRTIHKFRSALVGLLAAVSVLLMDTVSSLWPRSLRVSLLEVLRVGRGPAGRCIGAAYGYCALV
jgi:hypothetical protein